MSFFAAFSHLISRELGCCIHFCIFAYWICPSRCNFSKVHAFRRSHSKTFMWRRWVSESQRWIFLFRRELLALILGVVSNLLSWPGLLESLEELSMQTSLLLQGKKKKKWSSGFLNKWISFKWHLVCLIVSLKYFWTHAKMKIHSTSEN